MAKPRLWMTKIMENRPFDAMISKQTQYSIFRQEAQIPGGQSRAREKQNKLLAYGVDKAGPLRYTVGQKVRFRAGCDSPPAV